MVILKRGQIVSIIPVGDSVIITPRRLELDEARREIRKLLKASCLSEEDLLKGLQEEREKLYQKIMAKRIVRVFLDSNVILSGLFSDKGARAPFSTY